MIGYIVVVLGVLFAILAWPSKASGSVKPPAGGTDNSIETLIARTARIYGVEYALLKAHAFVESSLNPNAVNASDPSYGLMGITPQLAQDYGFVEDYHNPSASEIARLKDPETNLQIGARFIRYLHDKYLFDIAVQMYNCGEHGYNADGVRVPNYLAKVKRYYNEFRA